MPCKAHLKASKAIFRKFAGYIKNLSGQLERTSSELHDCELDEVAQTVSDFAKRNPALVFGGALLAGLALTRFIKSSRHRPMQG